MADDKDDDADNSKDADDNDIVGCGDEYIDYNNNYGDGIVQPEYICQFLINSFGQQDVNDTPSSTVNKYMSSARFTHRGC